MTTLRMRKDVIKMKVTIALMIIASLVCVTLSAQWCDSGYCPEGQCCAGSSYSRTCRPLSPNGMPCESPNSDEYYKTACPCAEGLMCSIIRRCQPVE